MGEEQFSSHFRLDPRFRSQNFYVAQLIIVNMSLTFYINYYFYNLTKFYII